MGTLKFMSLRLWIEIYCADLLEALIISLCPSPIVDPNTL